MPAMPALVRSSAPVFAHSLATNATPVPHLAGYQPVQHLSEGRWFELWLARAAGQCDRLPPDYVIKRVRDQHAGGGLPRALLQREAFVAARVSEANLVCVLDAQLEVAQPFVVLPYLPGRTLEQLRKSSLQTPVPQALWYTRQVAAALAALHAGGWLHSDVRPQNVIVSDQGHTTLFDLGLARQIATEECAAERWLAGDPAYLAPEAFQTQRQLTAAADIYSLGLVLLRLLQGPRVPVDAPLDLRRTLNDLRFMRPDVSRDVTGLLAKMLANEPLRRPLAGELVETISRLEIESLMQW
jgi:serine/threonine protein kinase